MSAGSPSPPELSEVDGVPVLSLSDDGPLRAQLHVRTGTADEPFPRRGWTHLVEHLALEPMGLNPHATGGEVGLLMTTFALEGTPGEVVDGLAVLAERLTGLPGQRLEQEKRVLRIEASGRRPGPHDRLLRARFGPLGLGSSGEPEWGLPAATADDLQAWSRARIHAGSAVLTLTGALPAGLRLPLGEPGPPVGGLPARAPVHPGGRGCVDEPGGLVVLGGTAPLGAAAAVLQRVLADRLVRVLRHERALSYSPGVTGARVGSGTWHLMAHVDGEPADQAEAARVLIDLLEELAADGPTEQELREQLARFDERASPPAAKLYQAAQHRLLGGPDLSGPAWRAALAGVEPKAVAAAARAHAADALLGLLDPDDAPAGWSRVLGWSPGPPDGDPVYREISEKERGRLTVTGSGIGLHTGPDQYTTLPWQDVVGVAVWDDDSHLLQGSTRDLLVLPPRWPDPDRLLAVVRSHVDPALLAPQGAPPRWWERERDARDVARESPEEPQLSYTDAVAHRDAAAATARRAVGRAAVVLVPLAVVLIVVLVGAAVLVSKLFGDTGMRAFVQFLAVFAAFAVIGGLRHRRRIRTPDAHPTSDLKEPA